MHDFVNGTESKIEFRFCFAVHLLTVVTSSDFVIKECYSHRTVAG